MKHHPVVQLKFQVVEVLHIRLFLKNLLLDKGTQMCLKPWQDIVNRLPQRFFPGNTGMLFYAVVPVNNPAVLVKAC
jgi:hypothetical protein